MVSFLGLIFGSLVSINNSKIYPFFYIFFNLFEMSYNEHFDIKFNSVKILSTKIQN